MRSRRMAAVLAAALIAGCGSDGDTDIAAEPRLETEPALLDAALECTPFEHPDKPPVLLVHGTVTHGQEQYNWTYKPLLIERGFDVCTVTYPDRGFGDQQIAAEYVVHALRRIRNESGRKVAMIGHSQGASMPRWAIKWWPSARDAVEDFVLLAGPNHGTTVAATDNPLTGSGGAVLGLPAAFYQFAPESQFVAAVNAGDETPGDIDYTNIYTLFDELVQPAQPVPTAALDYGQDNPKVTNLLLQDLCPLLVVDHLTIGLTDRATFELAIDAITHPGPADVERAGGAALCNALPLVPGVVLPPTFLLELLALLPVEIETGLPELHLVSEEPPLKPYAQ
ncbi:esterase/lipase family protein [Sinimarinibacterium flocculans]|uniref:esterase/lipase family protein n=1 Tax=Sinimarinibacterium flocculans TaxID=985250 RepID=UPI0024912790|nr:alpha/beta fold hydrolase [Sinimarinibacterium flocculans]